jgi:hypothetical protein
MPDLLVATEDALTEAIAHRIIRDYPSLTITKSIRRDGNGYLRSKLRVFCDIARWQSVLLITDLDRHDCPQTLKANWLRGVKPPDGLLLRVAVREVESWLLADHAATRALFGNKIASRLPEKPDEENDPKSYLLTLARHAPREVRLDLVSDAGSIARQGFGYNSRLTELVRTSWSPARAAQRSPSLQRAIGRIAALAGSSITSG